MNKSTSNSLFVITLTSLLVVFAFVCTFQLAGNSLKKRSSVDSILPSFLIVPESSSECGSSSLSTKRRFVTRGKTISESMIHVICTHNDWSFCSLHHNCWFLWHLWRQRDLGWQFSFSPVRRGLNPTEHLRSREEDQHRVCALLRFFRLIARDGLFRLCPQSVQSSPPTTNFFRVCCRFFIAPLHQVRKLGCPALAFQALVRSEPIVRRSSVTQVQQRRSCMLGQPRETRRSRIDCHTRRDLQRLFQRSDLSGDRLHSAFHFPVSLAVALGTAFQDDISCPLLPTPSVTSLGHSSVSLLGISRVPNLEAPLPLPTGVQLPFSDTECAHLHFERLSHLRPTHASQCRALPRFPRILGHQRTRNLLQITDTCSEEESVILF